MQLIDTHCHIHSHDYPLNANDVYERALTSGVVKIVCVGTDEDDSEQAVLFAAEHDHCWASVGLHPHDAKRGIVGIEKLKSLLARSLSSPSANSHLPSTDPAKSKIIAIGECGLDYFYDNSPKDQQIDMLHAQIELALEYDLPLIFHVRDAFDDFWPILTQYKGIRGVLHSFTDTQQNMEKAIEKGLFIGVNGISTFTKSQTQQKMYKSIPVNRMILETDAPFLTPVPKRGTLNEPAFVTLVAKKQADLHRLTLEELSAATSQNATRLFNFY